MRRSTQAIALQRASVPDESGGARRLQPSVVGLIADTHGLFRPEIARAFDGVALIVHAGDVGGASVLRELQRIAPVEAVYGNVDDRHDPALARSRSVSIGGLTIH